MKRLAILIILFSLGVVLSAQTTRKIKLIKANSIEYDSRYLKAQRILGNVVFEHEGSRMYCDSAWLYEDENRLKAFGKVKIIDPSGMSLVGNGLDYDGNEQLAEVREDVVMRDAEMTLTTDLVQYQLTDRRASYFGGGKIISSKNNNILTSESGFYFADSKVFHFKDDVELVNPDYTMFTDTLHYHSYNEQAYFFGPTTIISEENNIYCENGWYDTIKDRARFGENAKIWSKEQTLSSDSLFYDREKGLGEAFRNVLIEDTTNRVQIRGNYGQYLELKDESYVTGQALMEQFFKTDTLFVHADTLRMLPDTLEKRRILAYYNVRMFKRDMQGICDSLCYAEADSTLSMFEEPILWSDVNQISGTQIDVFAYEGKLQQFFIPSESFIISEVDSIHYNQIKGREMRGQFKENALKTVTISGNGECIYYATEAEEDSIPHPEARIIGVNKGACSDIRVHLIDNEIDRVNFMTKPENAFYPLEKLDAKELILKDFIWKDALRPKDRNDLFRSKESASVLNETSSSTD
jgi:lipopolysaccharide export system protein LptA